MAVFSFGKSGPMRGDCTADYEIILHGTPTVQTFVDTVLGRIDEWGYIGISNHETYEGRVFGDPHCKYLCGELESKLPDDVLNKKIKSVIASGGWSRMDYLIILEGK